MLDDLFFIKNSSGKDILPSKVWVTGFHSHFVRSNKSSPIGFPNYPEDYFDKYASRAYEMAQEAGLSAWAVTDYNFDPVRWAKALYPGKDLDECTQIWESVARRSAKLHTVPGNFIALCGFEYGKSINFKDLSPEMQNKHKDRKNYKGHVDIFGDMVIYNAPFIAPQQGKNDVMNTMELSEVYKYIVSYEDAFAVFPHPAAYPEGKGNNFEDLRLYEHAVSKMIGFEIWNGVSMVYKQRSFLNEYRIALQNGWKVGAMYNQDNVWPNWGSPSYNNYPLGFTMVIAHDTSFSAYYLTEQQLFLQLQKRKFYGSISSKLLLGILTDEGGTMGDALSISYPTVLRVQASGIEFGGIRIFCGTVGEEYIGVKNSSYRCGQILAIKIPVPEADITRFYFIEIIDKTGKPIAHSSPIWVTRKSS